ncbi:MAG: rod shape-determining protein MreC [Candidatus Limnocylindrales bacterium]
MFATRTSRRRAITFALLIAACLLLLAVSSTPPVQELRRGVGFALTPIQEALAGITRGAGSIVSAWTEIDRLRVENDALTAENEALRAQNAQLQELKAENDQLTGLLQVRSGLSYQTVTATVVGRGITSTERVMTVDRGSDDAIEVGDIVLGPGGALVGRVYEVGPNYARVLLVSDSRMTVIGMTETTRASGEVQGQLSGTLAMSQIPSTDAITINDTVVTAGLDLSNGYHSPFPKGLLIGRVVDVHKDPNAVVQTALVAAAADLDHLEYVLVITDYQSALPSPSPSPSPGRSPGSSAGPGATGTPSLILPSPSLGPAP